MKKIFFKTIVFISLGFFIYFAYNSYELYAIKDSENEILFSERYDKLHSLEIYRTKNNLISYIAYNNLTHKVIFSGAQGSVENFYKIKGFSFLEIPLNPNIIFICGKYNPKFIKKIKVNSVNVAILNEENNFWYVFLESNEQLNNIYTYDLKSNLFSTVEF